MNISLPHKGSRTEGIQQIKQLLEQHQSEIQKNAQNVVTEWKDNVLEFTFTTQKATISGTLTVEDKVFHVYAKLPLALRLFEGRIEKMIGEEIKKQGL